MHSTPISGATDSRFAVDTTFVLFFLAVDLGQSTAFSVIEIFSALTLGVVLVIPYFFPSETEKPRFSNWLLGRCGIAVFAVGLGFMFRQTLGVVLPEAFRFLPMTLLIVATMASCCLQFYAIIRFRLAR